MPKRVLRKPLAMLLAAVMVWCLFPATAWAAGTTLQTVDFEVDGAGYTVTAGQTTTGDDWWARTDGSTVLPDVAFTGNEGAFYFYGEDTDNGRTTDDPVYVTLNSVDVTGYTDLQVKLLVAANSNTMANKEGTEFLKIQYAYDGGAFATRAQYITVNGDTYYTEDTNADGTKDGASISPAFTEFTYSIPTTGTNLQIRIAVNVNSGSEEVAFDNIRLIGTLGADTTPPTLSAVGVSNVSASGATLSFTSDEFGTYYYLIYPSEDAAPDAATVKAQGAAVSKATGAASISTNALSIAGLSASTAYKAYVIVEDSAGNTSAVSETSFTSSAAGIADVWDGSADTVWYTSNTSAASYEIDTAEELAGLAELVNSNTQVFTGRTIVLAADLGLSGHDWVPIGAISFQGIFDGSGHTISNLTIGSESSPNTTLTRGGLFGNTLGATIKDISVKDATIYISTPAPRAGLLVGQLASSGTIINCGASGTLVCSDTTSTNQRAGGLVGYFASSTIINSYANANVTGLSPGAKVGGLIGEAATAFTLSNCYATGNVASANTYVGGIIGYCTTTSITAEYVYWNSDATHTTSTGTPAEKKAIGSTVTMSGESSKLSSYMKSSAFTDDLNVHKGSNANWAIVSGENGDYPVFGAANATPVATNVQITGTAQLGQTLTGSYDYSDGDSDPQGTSTFKWYRSNDGSGTGKTAIGSATATTYTVQAADLGKYVSFEVTPVASAGASPGTAVESSLLLIPAPTVTVNYDAEGGSVSPASQTKLYGSTYGKASNGTTDEVMPSATRTGHDFGGWWTGDNGTGTQVTNGTTVTDPAAHTLYAKWTQSSYTVTYQPGDHGALAGSGSESVLHGSSPVTVPGVTEDAGYTFTGWSSDGGSTLLTGAQVEATVVTAPITYTAYYSHNSYTVTYQAGTHGALVGTGSEPVLHGNSPVSVPDITEDEGYTFTGWSSDGGSTLLTKAQVEAAAITGAITYTAYYSHDSYTVTYQAGAHGSITGSGSESVLHGSSPVTVPGITEDAGYTFTGWSVDGGSTLLTKAQVEATVVTAPVTYTAYYSHNSYTVTYQAGAHGTLVGSGSESVLHGDSPVSVPGIAEDAGYTFTGWSTDGGSTLLTEAQVEAASITGAITYTAYYSHDSYSVTYQAGDHGSFTGSGSETVYHGDSPVGVPTIDADEGYTFTGWSADGGSTLLSRAQVLASTVTDAITYTAQYEQLSYTVTYQAGAHGALVGSGSEEVLHGDSPVSVPGITEDEGYTFTGWSSDGGSTLLTQAQVEAAAITDAITYTAYYSHDSYTVTYLAGDHGSLIGSGSETVYHGDSPASVPDVTADVDYAFTGWSSDGGITLLNKAQVEATVVTAPITYTAYYDLLTYGIDAIGNQTLAALVEGYAPGTQQTKTISITRAGTGDLENLAVALGGADASSFTITQPPITVLDIDTPSTSFTVKAKDGLPMGTYTAEVTVSADSMTDVTFTVTQVVSVSPATKRNITFVVSDGTDTIPGASITVNGAAKTTDSNGEAVYLLANGTYAFSIGKAGYTGVSANVAVGSGVTTICLVMAPVGQVVLPDDDGSTDAVLIADEDDLPQAVILVVDEETPDLDDTDAVEEHYSDYHIASLFDIYLLLGTDRVQPGAAVTVGIPIPASLQGRPLLVVRINDDGTITEFETTLSGNLLFFTTDHFSRYAILNANEDNPDTGDRQAGLPVIALVIGISVLVAAGIACWCRKRRTQG